jgi:hypothetical protein
MKIFNNSLLRVENFYAENPGDDGLAYFNVQVRKFYTKENGTQCFIKIVNWF